MFWADNEKDPGARLVRTELHTYFCRPLLNAAMGAPSPQALRPLATPVYYTKMITSSSANHACLQTLHSIHIRSLFDDKHGDSDHCKSTMTTMVSSIEYTIKSRQQTTESTHVSTTKVKGHHIYTPTLTGKPKQQRFTIKSSVLSSTSSRRRGAISGRPLPK